MAVTDLQRERDPNRLLRRANWRFLLCFTRAQTALL